MSAEDLSSGSCLTRKCASRRYIYASSTMEILVLKGGTASAGARGPRLPSLRNKLSVPQQSTYQTNFGGAGPVNGAGSGTWMRALEVEHNKWGPWYTRTTLKQTTHPWIRNRTERCSTTAIIKFALYSIYIFQEISVTLLAWNTDWRQQANYKWTVTQFSEHVCGYRDGCTWLCRSQGCAGYKDVSATRLSPTL